MKKMTKVAAFIGLAVTSSGAMAADWNVTQNANITVAAPSITQGATASVVTSDQALNGIALDINNDDLASGSQTATVAASTGIVLVQGPNVDGSNQAINYIEGRDIGSNALITQTVNQTAVSATSLTQSDTTATGNNIQAANLTEAERDVDQLSQVYTEAGTLTMTQSNVTSGSNTQGVNVTVAERDAGSVALTQSVTVAGVAAMTQGAGNTGGSNVQVGNGTIANTRDIDNTTQTFTANGTDLNLTQSAAGSNNIQATNYLDTSATGTIGVTAATTSQTTTISSGNANFLQDVSGTGNVQAGNLASSGEDIADLTQSFSASGAAEVDFDQTPTAASNTQAGNMAELSTGAGGDLIDEISQTFTSSTTSTDFNQNSASSNLIQAGNLIDITTGNIDDSGTTQQFDALGGSVSMSQSGAGAASSNLQALNGIIDSVGAGSGGTVSQALTVTSTTFTMSQENITSSGQFGNFVGSRL